MSEYDNKEKPKASVGGQLSDRSNQSDRTEPTENKACQRKLRPSGGYRKLRSFRTSTIIYDATVSFCGRFMDKRSRTVDQMVQAARSGRQNIAEGSRAGATSSKTETHLTNVARASLDELLLDFEDFLRQRGLLIWSKDDARAREVRAVAKNLSDGSDPTNQSDAKAYSRWLDSEDPAVVANAVICLIHQANYLLDQQIVALERQFVECGGYSEQLAKARIERRERGLTDQTDRSDKEALKCPLCGKLLTLRTARKGPNAGAQFWGCSGYPQCRGVIKLDGSGRSGRSGGNKE